jgi:hypothetical protein
VPPAALPQAEGGERHADIEAAMFANLFIVRSQRNDRLSRRFDGYCAATLFDAVRKSTDAEGVNVFYIELDGIRLTSEQFQVIAHSEACKDRLLAFNERLA